MPPALHSSLSSGSIITLLTTMALLAALPGVSVLAVTARSAGLGFRHGAATALGIVVGDLLFALLAILGLVLLLDSLGPLFRIIQLLGGTYLLWLSLKLWKAQPRTAASQQQSSTSLLNSFLTGLLITLADQKAVFFYLGFLPTILDPRRIRAADVVLILLTILIAVGGVKLLYAFLADRAGVLLSRSAGSSLNRAAAVLLAIIGLLVILKSLPGT